MSEENYYVNPQDNNAYNNDNYDNNQNDGKQGFAIASLVLGIVSVICCCGVNFITAILSIIFAIIVLVKKYNGRVKAIIGLILSSIILLVQLIVAVLWGDTIVQVISDYTKFASEAQEVIDVYEETGELPDYIEKYDDPEYDGFWEASGYDGIHEFMDEVIKQSENTDSITTNE